MIWNHSPRKKVETPILGYCVVIQRQQCIKEAAVWTHGSKSVDRSECLGPMSNTGDGNVNRTVSALSDPGIFGAVAVLGAGLPGTCEGKRAVFRPRAFFEDRRGLEWGQ